jgi:hypothetical protein
VIVHATADSERKAGQWQQLVHAICDYDASAAPRRSSCRHVCLAARSEPSTCAIALCHPFRDPHSPHFSTLRGGQPSALVTHWLALAGGWARTHRWGRSGLAAAASPATVKVDNFTFAPATLTITAGTTVT